MTATPFDYNEPLPDLHIIRHPRSWEPAARHYRDLTPEERAENELAATGNTTPKADQ